MHLHRRWWRRTPCHLGPQLSSSVSQSSASWACRMMRRCSSSNHPRTIGRTACNNRSDSAMTAERRHRPSPYKPYLSGTGALCWNTFDLCLHRHCMRKWLIISLDASNPNIFGFPINAFGNSFVRPSRNTYSQPRRKTKSNPDIVISLNFTESRARAKFSNSQLPPKNKDDMFLECLISLS